MSEDEEYDNYLRVNANAMAIFDSLPADLRREMANMRFGFVNDVVGVAKMLRMGYTPEQIKKTLKQMQQEFHAQGVAKGNIMKQDVK